MSEIKEFVVEKYYNEDNLVGIIVSTGFGAGWSTWNDDDIPSDFLVMDKTLIEMCLNKTPIEKVEEYIKSKFPNNSLYMGGWKKSNVFFVVRKTLFRINEYDGNESVEFSNIVEWLES